MISADRWTCPTCGRCIVIHDPLPPLVLRQVLDRRQAAHQQAHTLAGMICAELTLPGADSR